MIVRLRFSIRDLLWLTLVVALAVGWWLNRRALQAEIYRLEHPHIVVPAQYPIPHLPIDENAKERIPHGSDSALFK